MSNLAGKAYALTVISPVAHTWLNRWLYAVMRCLPSRLGILIQLQIIHFARWVILPADRWPTDGRAAPLRDGSILFASNFNGTWDVYLDEFSDILALGLDLLWYRGIGFPKSVPSSPFKAYIDHNTLDAVYYYNATPRHTVRDVNNAFLVRRAIDHLESSLGRLDADDTLSEAECERQFREEFSQVFRAVQNGLPTPGGAPLAGVEMEDLRASRQRRIGALEALRHPFGFLPRLAPGCSSGVGGHA